MGPLEKLSEREKAVLALLLQGKSNKQIALELGVASRTIEFHLSNIYAKLGVSSRSETILLVTSAGYLLPEKGADEGVRESTVASSSRMEENGERLNSSTRIPMRKKIFLSASIALGLMAVFLTYLFLFRPKNNPVSPPIGRTTEPAAASIQTLVVSIPTAESNNTIIQVVDSSTVSLKVNWFYIDSGRVYLETTLCGFPVPESVRPAYLIDPEKITLTQNDGSPVKIVQRVNIGGGSGPDNPGQMDKGSSCLVDTFDYKIEENLPTFSQTDPYHLTIPVGGTLPGESGKIYSLSSANFQFSLRPTYIGSLTFITDKTGSIDNKKVSFRGMEINPKSVAVTLCIFDPNGEQWLPSVDLLYRGNILFPANVGLVDGSSGDPRQELCYRANYAGSFDIGTTGNAEKNLSILIAKLSKDQPERLPNELIASAQNKLSSEGIEFNYVIVNHGADLVITKKPEGLTDAEVFTKIYNALQEDAFASPALVFDLN